MSASTHTAKSQDPAPYLVPAPMPRSGDDQIIQQAMGILERRLRTDVRSAPFVSPEAIKSFLVLHNDQQADKHIERFGVVFLDCNNAMVAHDVMFTGTLTQTSVYPREVVRAALRHNAASVVLTHNHPSGSVQPSRADELLTSTLRTTLALIDVRVLDHIIVGDGGQSLSMAEKGLI